VKRSLLVLPPLLVLVYAGLAGASVQSVVAPGPVTALAFQGHRIAFATGFAGNDCDRVRIWNVTTGAFARLGRSTACVKTSTGTGIAALELAGTRAVWLHYTGGNIREWTLWTATTTKPTPRRLSFVSRDVDTAPPIVLGNGDVSKLGDLLPYAVEKSVVALRSNGGRAFSWTAPAVVVALATKNGEVAVATSDGKVTVLDARAQVSRIETYSGPVSVVKLTGTGLLAQRGRTLELRTGAVARTWPLPAGATLEDADALRAYYVARGRVHELTFATSSDRMVASGTNVQAEGSSVVVSSGRRVATLAG